MQFRTCPRSELRLSGWKIGSGDSHEKLKDASQLPELAGESLEFTLDVIEMDGKDYQVIRLGDVEVWRELAFWDNLPRFNEIKKKNMESSSSR